MGKRRNSSDSSDSEDDIKPRVKNEEANNSSSTSSDEADAEWNKAPSKAKKRIVRKPAVKRMKKERMEDDEDDEREEGEVEDDDEEMENENDSESEFNDGYDEHLMGDEEDKERLAQMTEKEREQELFNRSEKREVLKTRFEIERKLRMQKKRVEASNNSNSKPSDSSLRSTERRRNMEDKSKVKHLMKGLKAEREKRKQKQQKLRASDVYSSSSSSEDENEDRRRSSSSSSSSSSDESEGGESKPSRRSRRGAGKDDEEDDDDDKGSDGEPEVPFVLSLDDLSSIQLSRHKISQWCHSPFFKDTVTGCFVRMGVGKDKLGIPTYCISVISDVDEGTRQYVLEKTRTNKIAYLKFGSDRRSFRFEFASNQKFTEAEFTKWKERMEKDRLELPTKEMIERKKRDIGKAKNHQHTESDIEAIVREKERFKKEPVNYAMKKTQLMREKCMAEEAEQHERVSEIVGHLDELEDKAKQIENKKTQNISAISYINERNRRRNIVEAERAIMEETKRNQSQEVPDDPFQRRKCAPRLPNKSKLKVVDGLLLPAVAVKLEPVNKASPDGVRVKAEDGGDQTDGNQSLTATTATPTPCPVTVKKEETIGGQLGSYKSPCDASPPGSAVDHEGDLFSAHNFDIQIDFDIGGGMNATTNHHAAVAHNSSLSLSQNSSAGPKTTNRRSLNLEEYKRKKGLI